MFICAARLALPGMLWLAACGCAGDHDALPRAVTADDPLRVVTTIQPLKLIAHDLVGGADLEAIITVEALLTPDQSPHGFEPSPSQMALLQRADVVILNGLGLDDWAKRGAARGSRVIVFADAVGIDAHDHHHHHHDHHDCDHHHGPVDEHLWLDPVLVGRFAEACAAELKAALVAAADHERVHAALDAAAQSFAREAGDVHEAYQSGFEPFAGRRIVTHHNVFSRITERYGLGEPIVLRPLASLEPTAGDLRRAIEAIRDDGIETIFIEPQFHAGAAERIRDETDVALVMIDPHGAQASSWHAFMHELLATLIEGLQGER